MFPHTKVNLGSNLTLIVRPAEGTYAPLPSVVRRIQACQQCRYRGRTDTKPLCSSGTPNKNSSSRVIFLYCSQWEERRKDPSWPLRNSWAQNVVPVPPSLACEEELLCPCTNMLLFTGKMKKKNYLPYCSF